MHSTAIVIMTMIRIIPITFKITDNINDENDKNHNEGFVNSKVLRVGLFVIVKSQCEFKYDINDENNKDHIEDSVFAKVLRVGMFAIVESQCKL